MADDNNNSENNSVSESGKSEDKVKKYSKKNKESIGVRLKKWFHAKRLEFTGEYRKIVWPSREELVKETIVVIVVSLLFGLYITVLDTGLGFLYSQFAQFASSVF